MTPEEHLSQEELSELKSSIGNLESTIKKIYSTRQPRELSGREGIVVRTLGDNFQGPHIYTPQYFDSRREKLVDTEFEEVIQALRSYDIIPTVENKIELLLEVGDILFQKEIIEMKYKKNYKYELAIRQFKTALKYINSELKKRQISFNQAKDFAEIKYGTRAWLSNNGYDAKNKPLELQLCLEAYNKK